jgi:hypothetical protein
MNDSKYILQKDCKLNGRDIAITRQQFRGNRKYGFKYPGDYDVYIIRNSIE